MERNNFIPDTGINYSWKNTVSDAAYTKDGAEAGNIGFSCILQKTF